MKIDVERYQTHWHPEELSGGAFAHTAGTVLVLNAWDAAAQASAHANGPPGRVLDTACGNARELAGLSSLGWEAIGMDPSREQLRDARDNARRRGQTVQFVRGVAEWLPFKPDVFDCLICKSALDHFVETERAARDFARVVRPGGRAVVSANNYGGITIRLSRLYYSLLRAVRPSSRKKRFIWDSPVPIEHTYECTFENTEALGAPYFDTLETYGVSLLWGLPVWTRFLGLMPLAVRVQIVGLLNRIARRTPRHADIFVFVWRPKKA